MKRNTAWLIIIVLVGLAIGGATYLGRLLREEDVRRNTTVITCEGDYRVFMRGDQFEVLYDPDCLKTLNIPELRST